MYRLYVTNKYNDTIELTRNEAFSVESTDGFDPPDASLAFTDGAGLDGSIFNSAKLENRTISITLAVNAPVEQNRLLLYRFFQPKQKVRFRYVTESRDVYCDGYIQSAPVDFYAKKEIFQVTAICPNPYLIAHDDSVTDFSNVEPLFEFPFDIESAGVPFSELHTLQEQTVVNNGDMETGALIELHAIGEVVNPSVSYVDTGEIIGVNYTLYAGDSLYINTREKQKGIELERNGSRIGLIGYMTAASTFFQLRAGESSLIVGADSGVDNLIVTVTIEGHFAGV